MEGELEVEEMAQQMKDAVADHSGDLGTNSKKVKELAEQLTKTKFCLKGVAEANRPRLRRVRGSSTRSGRGTSPVKILIAMS